MQWQILFLNLWVTKISTFNTDLTETQQEIVDINQRYEILGERLADRQQELTHMLDNVKVFLQDLEDLLKWLDLKEQEVDVVGPIPTNEREAKKRLQEHEVSNRQKFCPPEYFMPTGIG